MAAEGPGPTVNERCEDVMMAASSTELPPTPDAPRLARRVTMSTLTELGCSPEAVETAQLLVSELVTNTFEHAATPASLRLLLDGDEVLVEVEDGDPTPPRLLRPEHDALGGRGMALVDSLASNWGFAVRLDGDRTPVGKVVWFRLHR
jgi:anti-sigma regulatory factor (Ser/Thr protein kinase)